MSILIKNIDMPKDEELLSINIYPNGKVTIAMDLKCKQIATATSVVRCKDCMHSRTDDSNYDCYRCELTPGRSHFASSYCSMGERKRDDNDAY